ncbi:MAG TPA: prepilin-type N-terminal cleavage/methylation domain-containing protein, partial [Prosthecobacter sp.]
MKNPIPISNTRGFTLIEVGLSMTILSVIMLVSVQVLDQTQRTWKRGMANIEQFREARMAYESITQNVRQALLNTYLAYQYNNGDTPT